MNTYLVLVASPRARKSNSELLLRTILMLRSVLDHLVCDVADFKLACCELLPTQNTNFDSAGSVAAEK